LALVLLLLVLAAVAAGGAVGGRGTAESARDFADETAGFAAAAAGVGRGGIGWGCCCSRRRRRRWALGGEAPEMASRTVIQAMDRVYSSASFYFKELPLLEDDEITIKLAKLRQLELYAEYGDYLGQTLENVRKDLKAAAKASGDDEEMRKAVAVLRGPKSWVTIADELADTNMLDLRNGVDIACYRLGIDPNHRKWLIQEWASRNRTFHNRIRDQIFDCSWSSLAQKLSRDL
jgi:hypothetical protein